MSKNKTNYPEKTRSFISIGLLNMKLALLNMKIGAMINCNKDYSKFLVPKHYGIHWTFNFANPLSWFFVFAITVFLVLRVIFKQVKYLSQIGISKQKGKEK